MEFDFAGLKPGASTCCTSRLTPRHHKTLWNRVVRPFEIAHDLEPRRATGMHVFL